MHRYLDRAVPGGQETHRAVKRHEKDVGENTGNLVKQRCFTECFSELKWLYVKINTKQGQLSCGSSASVHTAYTCCSSKWNIWTFMVRVHQTALFTLQVLKISLLGHRKRIIASLAERPYEEPPVKPPRLSQIRVRTFAFIDFCFQHFPELGHITTRWNTDSWFLSVLLSPVSWSACFPALISPQSDGGQHRTLYGPPAAYRRVWEEESPRYRIWGSPEKWTTQIVCMYHFMQVLIFHAGCHHSTGQKLII